MTTTAGQSPSDDKATIDRLEHLLDEWRGRIDELLVQADLASKDVSEEVRTQRDRRAERLPGRQEQAPRDPADAGSNLGSLRSGVEKLLDDLRQAYQSAEAAIRRSRAE